jgi:hypothetical protein
MEVELHSFAGRGGIKYAHFAIVRPLSSKLQYLHVSCSRQPKMEKLEYWNSMPFEMARKAAEEVAKKRGLRLIVDGEVISIDLI